MQSSHRYVTAPCAPSCRLTLRSILSRQRDQYESWITPASSPCLPSLIVAGRLQRAIQLPRIPDHHQPRLRSQPPQFYVEGIYKGLLVLCVLPNHAQTTGSQSHRALGPRRRLRRLVNNRGAPSPTTATLLRVDPSSSNASLHGSLDVPPLSATRVVLHERYGPYFVLSSVQALSRP